MSAPEDERVIPSDEPMFIGWAPASQGTIKTAGLRGAVLVLVFLALGALLAASMRSPGDGLHALRSGESLVGLLEARPNGILWVLDQEDPDVVHGVLLSSQGRSAIGNSVAALDGHVVRLTGNLLERDGRRAMEVGAAEEATLVPEAEHRLRERRSEALGTVSLIGEIIDSKCYLGRMHPGAGRTHRACAQSRVSGGVPPLLVTHDADDERHFLLTTDEDESIGLLLLTWLARPVRLEGEASRVEDLFVVRTAPSRVHALP